MSNESFIECDGIDKCPCCNHVADMWAYQSPYGISHKDSWFVILCSKCGMRTRELSSKRQALKTWNRRRKIDKILEYIRGFWVCQEMIDSMMEKTK